MHGPLCHLLIIHTREPCTLRNSGWIQPCCTCILGDLDIQQDEYKKAEDRIIGEANKKRQVMLIGGGIVLLIGLAIFVK